MKLIFFILLFFNLNLIAAQENFYSTKDTTKLQIQRIDIKELMRKTLFDCLRDGKMDDLIIFCQSDLSVSFVRDSIIIKTQSATNYGAIEILKGIEKIGYTYFKVQYDLKYNGYDIVVVRLFISDLDTKSVMDVYLFLENEGSIQKMIFQWDSKKTY